jgi:putative colanic acid biosynthesis UDP-glucose lipid carrier transferase
MTEPVILKNSFVIALIALAQAVTPAIVAVGCLYMVIFAYGIPPADYFHVMALIVALLTIFLPHPPRNGNAQIFSGPMPLAVGVIIRWAIILSILLAIGYVVKFTEEYSRRVVLTWAVVTPALLVVCTLALHETMRRLLCDPSNARRAVFAGYNEVSEALSRQLTRSTEFCMSVAGFFDDRSEDRLRLDGGDVRLLGKLTDLAAYVKANNVQVIFIALPMRHMQRVTHLLDDLRDTTASIYYVPDIFVFDLIQARTGAINGIPVIAMCETPFYGFRGIAKRLTDIAISGLVLLMALPLLIGIAFAVRMDSRGPVIFRQRRYGLNGEEIIVYKFRTMTVLEDGDKVVQATKDDQRTTKVGRILRRYSLDELPQLINVLQGRMSLVGPRPHAVAHNEMYRKLIKGYMVRHKVLPGITGWAQVNGLRGETRTVDEMEARVRYDLEYLRNWSILLDLRILARTALSVLNDTRAF